MILTHMYSYKHVLSDMSIFFQKRKKKPKHLEPTYLSNYLNKTGKKWLER
jgi:hypothetical protein